MKTTIYAFVFATLIQLPLGYFFVSLESLVLGHGFIGVANGIGFYLLSVLFVSCTVILLFGLPVYFVLKNFRLNTTLNIAIVGFLIPLIILSVLNFGITSYEGYSAGENYYGTYRETFVGGTRTIWGWVKLFEEILTFGIHGVVGATIFHKVYLGKGKA
ncbi:hypothetical protein GCM10011613_20630 [Cellvibrio zantedeschiae]|uniref:Uncharacterized protein n=1 Tax=Cellvibrio zantedeschiae TaxID=1237077 RepID=A0ABQ3B643_9GAMM|nr:hypothetical protein [Cellvibrio zantedeschiae]GGY75023.1 hypothetical protein GCM10011613_20630 [Cellvibrio zantedeschiae]